MAKVSLQELATFTVDQLEAGESNNVVANRLAALLLDERRTRDLPKVLRAIDEELSARGSTQVTITAANETNEETKKQLAKLLGVDKPVFTEVIDKSVIGGVKARSGETEVDLTVRARLNKFKAQVNSGK